MEISYLFPPDQIHTLPTWRFVVHFASPPPGDAAAVAKAVVNLKAAEWKIITFPDGIDSIAYSGETGSVPIFIEVPDDRRRRPNSLADYESDFWKICGNVVSAGVVGDIYYEAIDWQDEV